MRDRDISKCIYKPLSDWKNILNGKEPVFILANGPSLSENNLRLLDGYFTIGINRILELYCPTILFFQDASILCRSRKRIIEADTIKVVRRGLTNPKLYADVLCFYLTGDRTTRFTIKNDPERIEGHNLTHGAAVQFASAIGASAIVLLGVDCAYTDGKTDFYGNNPHHPPDLISRCVRLTTQIKNVCKTPIYNCGLTDCWRRRKLEEVIDELKPESRGKEYFKNLFRKTNES